MGSGSPRNRSRWRLLLPSPTAASLAGGDGPPGGESDDGATPEPSRAPAGEPAAGRGETAQAEKPTSDATAVSRRRPLAWAQLLLRVLFIDALRCPRCETAMVVLALISDPKVVGKILGHLRLPTEPPALSRADPAYGLALDTWDEVAFVDEDGVDADADAGDRTVSPASQPGAPRPPP